MNALVEPSRGLIELYHDAGVLNAEIERLEQRGAQTIRIDAGSWDDNSFLHSLAHALAFPDYFGGNLDALADPEETMNGVTLAETAGLMSGGVVAFRYRSLVPALAAGMIVFWLIRWAV